ncbi:MAG: hypothetical protein ABEN55_05390, partial [Bradymonadaceae bacterium]
SSSTTESAPDSEPDPMPIADDGGDGASVGSVVSDAEVDDSTETGGTDESQLAAEQWPSGEPESEGGDVTVSSVVDSLNEISEPSPTLEAPPETVDDSEIVTPEWWGSHLADTAPEPLEADEIDAALAAATARGEPGICRLEGALDAARIFVDGPDLYEITFDPPRKQRALGWLFCRSDKLSEEELDRARQTAEERGTSVPAALIREGLMPRGVVEAGRRARLRELLPEVRKRQLAWATFQAFETRPTEFSHDPVSLRPVLFDRVYESTMEVDGETLETIRERFSGQRISAEGLDDFSPDETALDDREARFVERVLDEPKTFEQLVRESTLYENDVVRLTGVLEKLGWISVGEWDEETKTEKRQTHKLVQLKTQLEGNNRFEKFDVHWAAHQGDIEDRYADFLEAFDKLEGAFEPESHEAEVLSELRSDCRENYEFLSDRQQRRDYRREIKSSFQTHSAIQLYEDQLEQAQIQKDIPALRDHCRRLFELDPDHGEAAAFLEKLEEIEQD